MKKFISFSGGVESSAMCVLYGNKANAIFADTGFEHKVLYDQLIKVEKAVRLFHNNDFKIIRVKNEAYANLIEYILECSYYPNFTSRYCTRMFKIEPIDNYLKQFKIVEIMIGLNIDEVENRTGNHGLLEHVKYSYPLIDNHINRVMCIRILEALDISPNFPVYMKRGGCIGCYFKSKIEYGLMSLLSPDEFKIVQDLEEAIQSKKNNYFSIREGAPMKSIKEKAKRHIKLSLFKLEEILPTINNVTKCGVFCNR